MLAGLIPVSTMTLKLFMCTAIIYNRFQRSLHDCSGQSITYLLTSSESGMYIILYFSYLFIEALIYVFYRNLEPDT